MGRQPPVVILTIRLSYLVCSLLAANWTWGLEVCFSLETVLSDLFVSLKARRKLLARLAHPPPPPALNRLSYLSSSHHLDSVKPDKMSDVKEGLSVTLSACVSCLFNFSQHWWLSKFLLSSKLACRHYRWVANKQNKPEIRTSRLCPLTSLHACSSALINPSPRSTFYTAGFN